MIGLLSYGSSKIGTNSRQQILTHNAFFALSHVNNMRTPGDHIRAAQNRHCVASHASSPKDMMAITTVMSMIGMDRLQRNVLIYRRIGRVLKHTLLAYAETVV